MDWPIRAVSGWAAALLVVAGGGLSGCSSRSAGSAVTDSSSAFSAFARPQRPDDVVPASLWTAPNAVPTVDAHTDRRVAVSKSLAVYLVHAAPDVLCVIVQELPGVSTGGHGCNDGPSVIAGGMVQGWGGGPDPNSDHAALLIPDGCTATIVKGRFELAGQGVLVVQGDGVEVILTNNDGHTLRLSTPSRGQR